MSRITTHTVRSDIEESTIGRHQISVDIEVKSGTPEKAMKKANIIENAVVEALSEL